MEVILRRDVDSLGSRGEVVRVAAGYARNYLIPQGLAVANTAANAKVLQQEQHRVEVTEARERGEAEQLADKLGDVSCTITVSAGVDDKLYGSVGASDIAAALAEEGIEIDRRRIQLDEPIKTLGVFAVPVRIHRDVVAKVKVWVVKE
jgi:large subunit ribosomal protein L9